MTQGPLSIGSVIDVTTEGLAYGGDAVARHQGMAIFIPFAAPAERLRVRIVEKKKSFARATIEKILTPSPVRRVPPCQYYGRCGGCQLQHISYPAQVEAKAGFLRDALARIGHIDWPHEIEVRSAGEFGYRSRAQIKLEEVGRGGPRRVGFNRLGSHSVCDVEECPILTPELNSALASLRSRLKDVSHLTEVEVAAGEDRAAFEPELPGLPAGQVTRRVKGATYRFSPATFFQVNSQLLEGLVDEAVGSARGGLALDLYAGVGLFTVHLARLYGRVVGVESDRRAGAFARENLRENGVTNVEFYNARAESWLEEFLARSKRRGGEPPDFVLLDPPRSGAGGAVEHIAALGPARITYVSCDPTTLARDLRHLVGAGYEMKRVTAFDLFPQTYHVEAVVSLSR